MKRILLPHYNPAGLTAAGMAVYAAVVMIVNVAHHRGALVTPVLVAAVAAVASLLTRQYVTPVADPRDGNGKPLLPAEVVTIMPGVSGKTAVLPVPPEGGVTP